MSIVKAFSALCLISLLSGCASWQSSEGLEWYDTLPPRADFEQVYADDEHNQSLQSEGEYLLWVKRFYEGSHFYRHGWNDFAPEVVSDLNDPAERQDLAHAVDQLGRTIAAEWSKDSEHSRISTRHLSIWGNALRDCAGSGQERDVVEQISQDVTDLLNQQLSAREITSDRYFPEGDDDVFR